MISYLLAINITGDSVKTRRSHHIIQSFDESDISDESVSWLPI